MDYGHEQTDKELKKLERKLAREYKAAKADVERKTKAYFQRFDALDKKYAAKVAAGEMSKEDYIAWRKSAMMTGKRWEDLRDALAADLSHTNEIATGMINGHAIDCYALNMNYGTYEVENGIHANTSFTIYDHATVENLIKKDPKIIPKARMDIPKDKRWNRQKLTSAITQGILTGESIPKIAKRLAGVTDMNAHAALRNARTYTTAAENKGRVDSYERAKDMGIEMEQEWLATPDGRTRDSHVDLDGEKVPVGGTFSNGCKYPGDPGGAPEEVYNCRCTLVAALKDYKYDPTRFTRLPEGMTYEDWKGAHDDSGTIEPELSFGERVRNILDTALLSTDGVTTEVIREVGRIFAGDIKTEYLDEVERLHAEAENALAARKEIERGWESFAKERSDLTEAYWFDQGYGSMSKEEVKARYEELTGILTHAKEAPEYLAANEKVELAQSAYAKMRSQEKIGEYMKQKIGEVREVGIGGLNVKAHLNNSRSPVRPIIENAYDHYPTAWVRRSIAEGNLAVKSVNRGYYWHEGAEIAISGSGKNSKYETSIHELGHRFEKVVPGMMEQEKEFYEKRTAGEALAWLGPGYSRDEKTRADKFLSPYMGKDYGGDGYELVSMGFEYAYTDPARLAKDPDMQEWIYGLLLAQ